MRNVGAGLIDGYGNQEWDKKENKCVFDYLIFRYSNIPGFKLICENYQTLQEFFRNDYRIYHQFEYFWRTIRQAS